LELPSVLRVLTSVDIGPTVVTAATVESALAYTEALLKDGEPHRFSFCEGSLLSSILRDPVLPKTVRGSDAVFADGVALLTLARLHGRPLPGRVPGPSFMLAACGYGVERGWRHFFYGGAPGVPERLAERLQRDYPGMKIVGTYSPPFRPLTEVEELEVKEMIETAKPHLLWVGLGSPKQEFWCADHLGKINVPLLLPVGAAFDFHSGNRLWAPRWVRAIGMEWLFRTITGGKRIFLRNLRCVTVVGLFLAQTALRRLFGRLPKGSENGKN
jgi:N-acetylglucosaminyldiphosphoundecaprenol N-acetyl-beta-D-mannosaminyltransferase